MQIFISYAREDVSIAEKLRRDLLAAGYKPWMDTREISGGERWLKAITTAIESSEVFVVFLSKKSQEKRFVQQEIALALVAQDENPHRDILLVPLRVEDFYPENERLNERNWINFFSSYERGKEDLLAVLHRKRQEGRSAEVVAADNSIFELLSKSWEIKEVTTIETGDMQIVADILQINELTFSTILVSTLYGVQQAESRFTNLKQITIMNRFRRQGWVYEAPQKYEEILRTPATKLQLMIAADTHLL